MIFIVRHQAGTNTSNCLKRSGMYNIHQIARRFSSNPHILNTIYTIKPHNYKHIRQIQTASYLCTMMDDDKSVLVCNTYEDVVCDIQNFTSTNDIIIVWHHNEMTEMLRYIEAAYHFPEDTDDFHWPESNYNGCLMIDVHNKAWTFNANYFGNFILIKYLFENFPCFKS